MQEYIIFEGKPSQIKNFWYFLLSLTVIGVYIAFKKYFETKCTNIKISNQKITIKSGILFRKTNFIELYRIRDIQIEQPLWLRLFRLANLKLLSNDKTDPVIVIEAIKNIEYITSKIRKYVEIARNKNRRIV